MRARTDGTPLVRPPVIYLGPILESTAPSVRAYAAIGRRARAYLLDLQIVGGLMVGFLTLADWGAIPHRFGPSFVWAGMAALILYEPLFVRLIGGTLGHRLMGLRVIGPAGGSLSLVRALTRTVLKWATIGYVGPVLIVVRTRRAPWDVMVGSLVLDERKRSCDCDKRNRPAA